MNTFRKIGILLFGVLVVIACSEFGERLAIPGVHGFVSRAEAVVGRPLTPVSVAGVARRTALRSRRVQLLIGRD